MDYLAQVFDVLKTDLKEESAKEWFLRYQATQIIIPFLKMTNKALMGSAIDVFLQMSMESGMTFFYNLLAHFWSSNCNMTLSYGVLFSVTEFIWN